MGSPPSHSSSGSASAVPLPPPSRVGLYEVTCLVGYSMLPLVLASAAALLLPVSHSANSNGVGAARALLVGGAALWSSRCASKLFAARWPALRQGGGATLAAYPCAMLYCALALLTLYSKNGGVGGGGATATLTTTTTSTTTTPPVAQVPPPPPVLTT